MSLSDRSIGLAACAMALLPCWSFAEPPPRDHDITLDDYFSVSTITRCAASPDGRRVAYTESRWEPPHEKRNTDLWVVDVNEPMDVRRLTFDKAEDGSPEWSPDGRYIYFTSNIKRGGEEDAPYNGKKQVWRIGPEGGEPQPVTRIKDGVGLYDLSNDGRTLYYTVTEEHHDDEWKDLRKSHDKIKYGHGVTKFSQIWSLDLTSWRAEKLVDEKRVIGAMEVSPAGGRIVMVTTPDEEIIHNEGWSRLDVYDMKTKTVSTVTQEGWRKEHPSPYGWIDGAAWSRDGAALAFTVSFDGYPTRVYGVEWLNDEPGLRELERPKGVSLVGGTVQWRGKSRDLCFLGEERARSRLYSMSDVRDGKQGPSRVLTAGDIVAGAFSFADSGDSFAAVISTTEHVEDIYRFELDGKGRRITNVNPQIDTWKLPRISLVQWKGARGDEVEGVLELPPDYQPGKTLPMLVDLHGGPTAASPHRLIYSIYGRTLMPAKGYAVFSPNYRGSTGYGDKFMTDLVGHENEIEVEDILRGVDAMVDRGIADPQQLGVMGWSNGGFLTNCLIVATDRFKAASSGAGMLDMVIQWGTEDTPGHVINFLQGLPWDDGEAYRAASPLYRLGKAKTPTLIHVGENDERVPAAHARALYRGLKYYLGIPTELLVYPDEGHGLIKYANRKAKMEWDLAWFDRHVRGQTPPREPPKPDGTSQ